MTTRDTKVHDVEYRVRFTYDTDFQPEGCDGQPLPESEETYAKAPHSALIDPNDDPQTGARRDLPYDEYVKYYGNPDRHVGIAVLVDRKCPCCGQWGRGVESLWGIDCMDDDQELQTIRLRYDYDPRGDADAYTAVEARALPGYLGQIARDLLDEAGYQS